MQDDHPHERALAQLGKLMDLRQKFLHHKSVLISIDYAIGNVFEPENHCEISKHVIKIRELVDTVRKMDELGAGTTSIDFRLPNLRVSEAKPQNQKVNAKYEQLRDVKQQLAVLGIPTVGVDNAMADILMKPDNIPALKVLEEPAIVKEQPLSGIKSEPSKDVSWQSGGYDLHMTPYSTRSASRMKRSAPIGDTGSANPKDEFQGETNESKRRKASLNVLPRGGKECTEAWRVPVNVVSTEGLSILPVLNGSLLLTFDPKTQSIVVFSKEECLSLRYPCLELVPACIYSIKRNSLKTKENFKARLSLRDRSKKFRTFQIEFPTIKDWETFQDKLQLSSYDSIPAIPQNGKVMDDFFEEGLWLRRETGISGIAAKI